MLEKLAKDFATYHHDAVDQKRKYTGFPYIVHPAAVVALVKSVPHTEAMVAAAWLHDVVEDTKATIEEVAAVFGDEVAELVAMVTNPSKPSDGNRAARKAIDLAHLSEASPDAKTIKLADVADNVKDIASYDPKYAKVYLKEKVELLKVLGAGDPVLFKKVSDLVGGV